MKNKLNTLCLLIILIANISKAQPYYFTSNYKLIDSTSGNFLSDIYRINFNNAEVETLFTNHGEVGSVLDAETNSWLAIDNYNGLEIVNVNDTANKYYLTFRNQGLIRFDNSAAINRLIISYDDAINFNTIILIDPADMEITDTISYDLLETNFDYNISKTGDKIYFRNRDTLSSNINILTYSLLNSQIINSNELYSLGYPNSEGYLFNFRRHGKGIVESYWEQPSFNSYFNIYDFDTDSNSIFIHYDGWAEGYEAKDGLYLLLFNMLADSSLELYASGSINIYDMQGGSLLKTLTLPSNGKIYCFNNYPNNIYYVIDIEEPTRQIYTLKMDSIFNVLDLTSLNPSSAIVNSPPFTLTVNGHGFDSLSTVYFNDTAKTTTYVSDSVLTAEISTSDISTIGNYPVWVTDEWGTSDTLTFTVVPHPPVLSSISPAIYLRPIAIDLAPPGVTVTATGEFFSHSSVAYFNGNAKATTYISDTVVTFQLSSSDISTVGNYPVWISNYGSNSDTLIFSVTNNLPQSITPTLQCVRNNGGGSYTAYFGYNNNNSVGVYIPISSKNKFSPTPIDRGQPKIFLPGSHTNVFSVNFNGTNLTWTLNQASVTANRNSAPCP
jgi:hypothetical protein